MFIKKNSYNLLYIFLLIHLIVWTLVPSISNVNLPLDTIEALAWGRNLDWGFDKHPPLSAFMVEMFYQFFGKQDWAYYLLSQIFVVVSFFYVFKFSEEFFKSESLALISVLLLEGIFFYNYTSPEFNVNVCQLPFWTLSVYFTWRCIQYDRMRDYVLLGIFIGLGILSKYLFIYLLIAIKLLFIYHFKNRKKIKFKNYFVAGPVALFILLPHIIWLVENDFVSFIYALERTGGIGSLKDHFVNPLIFLGKQIYLLVPFLVLFYFLIKKLRLIINFKDKNFIFLLFIVLLPIVFMFLTSLFLGVKIRTMWMTPFYLFIGVFFIKIFKQNLIKKNFEKFFTILAFIFFISPITYIGTAISNENKRTAYPGKEIARLVEYKWDENFRNEIKTVIGDEWYAGNLSYHLSSRPSWTKRLKDDKTKLEDLGGVIYTGNPNILKKICPGVYGTIKPVGYCMIGVK